MANVVKETRELVLLAAFSDEDDRTIVIPDPQESVTKSQIDAIASAAANVLIGDKYGADFTRFKRQFIRLRRTTYLDVKGE